MVEQRIRNAKVTSSIPVSGTIQIQNKALRDQGFILLCRQFCLLIRSSMSPRYWFQGDGYKSLQNWREWFGTLC